MQVIKGMTNADYRKAEGISKSDLDLIAKSPLHFHYAKNNPQEPTPAMRFGSAFHAFLLERDTFNERYVTEPEGINRRTNAGKEEYEAFLTEAKGKEIISKDDLLLIEGMTASVFKHDKASKLLAHGEAEQSFFFNTPIGEIKGKCRPDWITKGTNILCDVKTSIDASPQAFAKSIANFNYHKQAAYYLDGTKEFTGNTTNFVFIVVEKTPPFAVACYVIEDRAIELGRTKYLENLVAYHYCLENEQWGGYSSEIEEIFLPEWAYK